MNLKDKKINVLGDSITQGVGTTGKEFCYHTVLGRETGAALVRNYGISATRIARQLTDDPKDCRSYVERYQEMDDDADLVIVFGGTNDYGHGNAPFGTMEDRTMDTFCGACHLLFEGLIKKYPDAQIVIMTPLQRAGGENPSAANGLPLSAYSGAIQQIAAKYALPVLDLYSTSGICADIEEQRERFCPDGLHPNNAGNARIAARLEAFLRAL